LVLIIALLGQAEPAPYTCGICGFVMHEVGESHGEAARCKLMVEGTMEEANGGGEGVQRGQGDYGQS
jgi:hypothetical protein